MKLVKDNNVQLQLTKKQIQILREASSIIAMIAVDMDPHDVIHSNLIYVDSKENVVTDLTDKDIMTCYNLVCNIVKNAFIEDPEVVKNE